jgi:hypothetical protein
MYIFYLEQRVFYTLEDLKPHPLYYFLYFSQNNIDD